MAIRLLQHHSNLFPLSSYLAKEKVPKTSHLLERHQPILILSQIKDLDRELVERLEMAGIYDTQDFFDAHPQIREYLGLGKTRYALLVEKIETIISFRLKLPRIILQLPDNYAFLAIHISSSQNTMALLWRGLFYCWSDTQEEGWHQIKYAFDRKYKEMGRPELIAALRNENLPTWFDRVSDISTYFKNIDTEECLGDQLKRWGIELSGMDGPCRIQKKSVLELAYLVFLSRKIEDNVASLCTRREK